jgi:alcohol dehydrogenase
VAHALQYPIGARTHTPHGLGTGLLLAYAMRFNLPVREAEMAAIARAMGEADAVSAVARLASDVGVPSSLAEIGINEGELGELAEQATAVTRLLHNNPREAGVPELREILAAAWRGDLAPPG